MNAQHIHSSELKTPKRKMTLTLRSSASFISLKDTRSLKTPGDISGTVCFAHIKPSCRLQAKSSMQEAQLANDETLMAEGRESEKWEKLHAKPGPHSSNDSRVAVFVMLPLDTITNGGSLNRPRAMNASLMALRSAGVEGVMVDAWWGLVEKDGPLKYNWEGYAELVRMVQKHGLKLQVVMSFHQCGGNVGDSCSIPLPPWVLEEISKNPDLVYTDRSGRRNPEYISLGCDSLPLLGGRTPIQVYSDYMRSFRQRFKDYLGEVIMVIFNRDYLRETEVEMIHKMGERKIKNSVVYYKKLETRGIERRYSHFGNKTREIQAGMGPCGELRYPAYPESNGTWRFPGIGEFQCYDKYMRASLEASAEAIGKKDWGRGGPHDSGQYNLSPEETGFFRRDGTWNTEYGKFFLEWYSGKLLEHGEKILEAAEGIFQGTGAKISGKVAGIHWHYRTRSHAAELTSGYYNTRHHDGYLPIARMFSKHGVVFNFTCMEMRDGEQPEHANCSPQGLVRQVKMATRTAGIELAGENALERYDAGAYTQVLATSRSESGNGLTAFTYLRMNKKLFEGENWRQLVEFVKTMSEGGRNGKLSECDSHGSNLYIGFIKDKSVQKTKEAALA